MSRGLIVAVVVIVALTVYAVVDCAMTNARRTRVLQKPIWLVVNLLLPVVGPLLWIFFGKQPLQSAPQPIGPDEDTAYLARLSEESARDARIRELEEQMRKLDEEIDQARRETMRNHPSNHTGSNPVIAPEPEDDEEPGDSDQQK